MRLDFGFTEREKTDSGICLSYLAKMQSSIHNSNMLGAAILVRTAKITGRKALKLRKAQWNIAAPGNYPTAHGIMEKTVAPIG